MALQTDLENAINSNLTAEVGTRLKKRLEQADEDSVNLIGARSQIEDLKASVRELDSKVRQYSDTVEREKILVGREREMDIKEAVMEERTKGIDRVRADLLGVVNQVFKGPVSAPLAFQADLYGNINSPMGTYNASMGGSVKQEPAG